MRLSLRFIIPLFLALGAFAYAVVPLVDKLTLRWFVRDLETRSTLIANTVQEPLEDLIRRGQPHPHGAALQPHHPGRAAPGRGLLSRRWGEAGGDRDPPVRGQLRALDRFSDAAGEVLSTAHGPVLVSVRPLERGPASWGRSCWCTT